MVPAELTVELGMWSAAGQAFFGTSETHKSYKMGRKMIGNIKRGCEPFWQIKGIRPKLAPPLFLVFYRNK